MRTRFAIDSRWEAILYPRSHLYPGGVLKWAALKRFFPQRQAITCTIPFSSFHNYAKPALSPKASVLSTNSPSIRPDTNNNLGKMSLHSSSNPETGTPPMVAKYSHAEIAEQIRQKFLEDCTLDAAIDVYLHACKVGGDNNELLRKFVADMQYTDTPKEAYEKHKERFMKRQKNMESIDARFTEDDMEPSDFLIKANDIFNNTADRPHLGPLNTDTDKSKSISKDLIKELKDSLVGERAQATFACGGSIPAAEKRAMVGFETTTEDDAMHMRGVRFPVNGNQQAALTSLIKQCSPASFGVGGKEVLDTEYRSALKLDNDKFVTNFHPYDAGIISVIQQILLPTVCNRQDFNNGKIPFITAELYKLNIYSGPSDKFRPHVDTPRSEKQFGSLVVCLPCQHEGGELQIRHNGRTASFDWGASSSTGDIQWAAFYSDCEHEILQVTAGHRCTLTYNLYLDDTRLVNTIPPPPLFSNTTLPLYAHLQSLLQNPSFLPNGGVLGYYCDHRYPHTSSRPIFQPSTLKGADAALFTVLESLSLPTRVSAILDDDNLTDYALENILGSESRGWGPYDADDPPIARRNRALKSYRRDGKWKHWGPNCSHIECTDLPISYYENQTAPRDPGEWSSFERRRTALLNRRRVAGWNDKFKCMFIQETPQPFLDSEYMLDSDEQWFELVMWNKKARLLSNTQEILWLNDPKEENKQSAVACIMYGNEPSHSTTYSSAAIVTIVPPSELRCANPEGTLREGKEREGDASVSF